MGFWTLFLTHAGSFLIGFILASIFAHYHYGDFVKSIEAKYQRLVDLISTWQRKL